MYRGKLWTMRQYAGFGSAAETNARFKYLLENGQTGLSVAFDLPTQMGMDSDHPLALGEVGKVGCCHRHAARHGNNVEWHPTRSRVHVHDNQRDGCQFFWRCMWQLRRNRVSRRRQSTERVQNDILKEYIARGTYIYPPKFSLRLITDIFAYCQTRSAKLEHDFHQRISHSRSRIHGRPGAGIHFRKRDRLCPGAL